MKLIVKMKNKSNQKSKNNKNSLKISRKIVISLIIQNFKTNKLTFKKQIYDWPRFSHSNSYFYGILFNGSID